MPNLGRVSAGRHAQARLIVLVLFGLLGATLPGRAAYAQGELPVGGARPAVRLEIQKPFTAADGPFTGSRLATSIWDASVVVPLDPGLALFGRFGLSYASIEARPTSATTSNPRLGVVLGDASGVRGEVHVDVPLAQELGTDDSATGVAFFADYERLERFLPAAWSVGASGEAATELQSGSVLGTRLGGTLLLSTDGTGDAELFALYAFFGRVPAESWSLTLELSGIAVVTESLSFSERNSFFASISIEYPDVRFAPELFLRAPVDDQIGDFVRLIAGVRLRLAG